MPMNIRFTNISEVWTRQTLASSFIVANSLVWYFVVLSSIQNLVDSESGTIILIIHFSAIIISALAGAYTKSRMNRNWVLPAWILLGVATSLVLPLLNTGDFLTVSLLSLLFGAIFGFGMPICVSKFSESIRIEHRGRASGLTLFITALGLLVFMILNEATGSWSILVPSAASVWRLTSFLAYFLAKSPFTIKQDTQSETYAKIIKQKSLLMYLIPWLLFSLVNYLTAPLVPIESNTIVLMVQVAFAAIFGIIGGFLIDTIGRKKIAISGFVFLGMGTAVLAIYPGAEIIQYFNAGVDGIAWGFILVLFTLTIWGDLSNNSTSEKYYAIGLTPFFVSMILEKIVREPAESLKQANPYAFFSFTTLFLIIAVLPLFYALETLPEKVIKDRDLKSYVEKAMKKVQIETENEQSERTADPLELAIKSQVYSDDYEEAKELAEKYY